MHSIFVPGWGAPADLYAPLLPEGWTAVEPPSFAVSNGALAAYAAWLDGELCRRGRAVVGGHSMGGALALVAAAARPQLVERLVLVSPAGLPLTKPIRRSVVDFARQLRRGIYPRRTALAGARSFLAAPRAALRLALDLRALDLRRECERVRAHGIRALVVGCTTDDLVQAESARAIANMLDADYVELDLPGGHMWMLHHRAGLAALLQAVPERV